MRLGLGQVNVVASMIFAGMSGAAVADASGLGPIEIKAMLDADYDIGYSAAITAASSAIGPIIPPSIPLVIYGIMAEASIGRLLLGGILPGMLIGIFLMLMNEFYFGRKPGRTYVCRLVSQCRSFRWLWPLTGHSGGRILSGFTPPRRLRSPLSPECLSMAPDSPGAAHPVEETMRSTAGSDHRRAASAFAYMVVSAQSPQMIFARQF